MTDENTFNVKFFASCREIAGIGECTITLPKTKSSAIDLINHVIELHPDLSESMEEVSVAVNKKYISDKKHILMDGDIVAFIPPISGG